MHEIEIINNKSKETLKQLKAEITELIELDKSKAVNFNKLKVTIKKIHEELEELEKTYSQSAITNHTMSEPEKEKFIIKKKITIKKTTKSKSFISWLFNNSEI